MARSVNTWRSVKRSTKALFENFFNRASKPFVKYDRDELFHDQLELYKDNLTVQKNEESKEGHTIPVIYEHQYLGTRDRNTQKLHGLIRIVDDSGWICERCYLNGQPHGLSITYYDGQVFVRFY